MNFKDYISETKLIVKPKELDLKDFVTGKAFKNKDGSYDVYGSVYLQEINLKTIPWKFNKVSGNFYCHTNYELTSLEGCPKYVGKKFDCSNSELSSLKHCPKYVGESFYCRSTDILSLEHSPIRVGKNFDCSRNDRLSSLKGCPKKINGNFDVSYCDYLDSKEKLKYGPKYVGGNLYCRFVGGFGGRGMFGNTGGGYIKNVFGVKGKIIPYN